MNNTTKSGTDASAAEAAKHLNGRRSGSSWIARCPAHEDSAPSLQLSDGDAGLMVHCHAGCNWKDVKAALVDMGLIEGTKGQFRGVRAMLQKKAATDKEQQERAQRKIQEIWGQTLEVQPGDAVHTYLTVTRGLALEFVPPVLRFHPNLPYWKVESDKPRKISELPAMVAAITDSSGNLCAIHQTYLDRSGKKADLSLYDCAGDPVRKVRGSCAGGSIKLYTPGPVLVVAEGIETALAAMLLSRWPSWAAYSATALEKMVLPEGVERLYICQDNDDAGKRAAKRLAQRAVSTNVKVFISQPPTDRAHADWADVIREIA